MYCRKIFTPRCAQLIVTPKHNGHPAGWPCLPIGYADRDARIETESLPPGPTLTAGLPRLGRVDGERPAVEVLGF